MMWACQNAENAHHPHSSPPFPTDDPHAACSMWQERVQGVCVCVWRGGSQRQWRNIKHLPLISISFKMMAWLNK